LKSLSLIQTYHKAELQKYFDLIELPSLTHPTKSMKTGKRREGDAPAQIQPIFEGCSWMRHCYEDADILPEPEWYAMLSILGRCHNGGELAHEWSKSYPGYSECETDKKLEHALKDAGPVTCRRVYEITGNIYCKDCRYQGIVTSPIRLGVFCEEGSLSQAKAIVQTVIDSGDVAIVFKKENIEVFRMLKEKSFHEFAQLKSKLKERLKRSFNIKDFERAMKQSDQAKLRMVLANEEAITLDELLEDIPVAGLKKPNQYNINMQGIWKITVEDKQQIFPIPVIISRRLKNVDTDEEKIELAYFRDQKWNRVITERSIAMNKNSIIKLADVGLPIHSENAKEIVKYLGAFDATNLDTAYTRSVSHMGWIDGRYDRFLPGANEGIQLDVSKTMGKGYRAKGTLEQWLENVHPILEYPMARLMLAASFASPLLRILSHRNFLIYLYGGTRGGKTAALKMALSVWGNPEETMTSFNSTRNALERRAAFYSDLPLGIDERQIIGDQQSFVESIAYMMGNGQSRGRATRDGKLQEEYTWHNIVIATGEDPLSNDHSSGGVSSRTLEMYGKPIDHEELAGQMHRRSEEVYGVAGPEFIQKVIAEIKRRPDMFKGDFKRTLEELKHQSSDNVDSHISSMAAILIGDLYMSIWLFGVPEKRAMEDIIHLGGTILQQLEKKSEMDDAKRAYDAFISWFHIKEHYFKEDEARERYGWLDQGLICVRTKAFRDAMKELGFHERRIRRDWAARGWIEVEQRSGEVAERSIVRKWNSTNKQTEKVVAVKRMKTNNGQ
jgi:putative DNA primase/helicase